MTGTREIRLAGRPFGTPTEENFTLVETELPAPAEGQVLVRNLFMSVDPCMRLRMNDPQSYAPVPPFPLGEPLDGGAVGEVVVSRVDGLATGDLVLHRLGWREHALVDGRAARKLDPIPGLPSSVYLGALGMPGLTAYVGLLDIAELEPGEVVFVTAAAGAVGSMVGQIARLRGAERVMAAPARPRRSPISPRGWASTPRSTTATATSIVGWPRPRRTASTCTSTTSAAITSRPRSLR